MFQTHNIVQIFFTKLKVLWKQNTFGSCLRYLQRKRPVKHEFFRHPNKDIIFIDCRWTHRRNTRETGFPQRDTGVGKGPKPADKPNLTDPELVQEKTWLEGFPWCDEALVHALTRLRVKTVSLTVYSDLFQQVIDVRNKIHQWSESFKLHELLSHSDT